MTNAGSSQHVNMSNEQAEKSNFLHSFTQIYYICKLLGIYPHDFQRFHEQKALVCSKVGSCVVVAVMIIFFVGFNLMLYLSQDDNMRTDLNNLDAIITIVFTYIGPAMMLTDQVTALRNQTKLAKLYERIAAVDTGLQQLEIKVNNCSVRRRIWLFIVLTLISEIFIFLGTYLMQVDHAEWTSLLWIFACLPTFYNTLDKIWFLGILLGLKTRFEAINEALDAAAEAHAAQQQRELLQQRLQLPPQLLHVPQKLLIGRNEVSLSATVFDYGDIELSHITHDGLGELVRNSTPYTPFKAASTASIPESEGLNDCNATRERFVSLCQLHDSICNVAKMLNELWSYPILALMAYSFVIFTTQLYFLYCATQGQVIPLIFRSAKDILITVLFLFYISGKCVLLMFYSWKTMLASRRTGICLHKCGLAADNNEVYEIVNHLSLKLFNHAVNFSACGFFTLDMNTLYAICGAITSYLIILIQFNMAGQQVKHLRGSTPNNGSELLDMGSDNATVDLTDLMVLPELQP